MKIPYQVDYGQWWNVPKEVAEGGPSDDEDDGQIGQAVRESGQANAGLAQSLGDAKVCGGQ